MPSVVFTYNGSNEVVATIYDPVPAQTYYLLCSDPASTFVSDNTGSPMVLTVNDVGGLGAGDTFGAKVADDIFNANYVGAEIFEFGSTTPFVFSAAWTYDGIDSVSVQFTSSLGINYAVFTSDTNNGDTYSSTVPGTGGLLTITVNPTSDPIGNCILAVLYDVGSGQQFSTRVFSGGESGSGRVSCGVVPGTGGLGPCEFPVWRFVVTDLAGATITMLDHLASERVVTPKLNEPLEVTGTVPSDNSEINILHTDGFPFLAEGVRQLYCLRRESDSDPFYTARASTIIMQVDDAAHSDDARTRFTAWDPWQYLFSVPVLQSSLASVGGVVGVDGKLIGSEMMVYPPSMRADEIALDIITTTRSAMSVGAPAAAQALFIDIGSGTIEQCATFSEGWEIQQLTSVGQALKDLSDTGYMDIVFTPIYDSSRPGILCEMNIYKQTVVNGVITKFGAGSYNYGALFAWDTPGRSLVGADNLYDGTGRANHIQYFYGQGGPATTSPSVDATSIALYGEYWAQQAWPGNKIDASVQALGDMQLALRSTYKETLTVNPAPERSPEPFTDYFLGDGVRVSVSNRMRQALTGWQRVYGIPIEIDDNGMETVRELIVGPVGPPPPVAGQGTNAPELTSGQVAVNTSRQANRGGTASP